MTATAVPRLRHLLDLAWPVVLARATQAVIGFCDALMVAPLGEAALAATTTGGMNAFVLMILPMGTVFILQSFAAQLRGRGEMEAVGRYALYGLILAVAAGVVAIAAIPLVPHALGVFAFEPAVTQLMSLYLGIRLFSVGAAVATEALGNWYGGLGNTRLAMFAGLLAMVVNVSGNYLLIEPRFGLPGWGVEGAAWASVAGTFAGLGVLLAAFLRNWRSRLAESRLRMTELRQVLRFGLPNGLNWFLEFAAFMLFINVVVAHLGTTELAAINVVIQINSIAFMPAFGVASAGAILVGEAIGRRSMDSVWPIVRMTAAVAAGWMCSVGLLYILLPETLMRLFQSADASAELVTIGATMLMLSAAWQLFDALGITLNEALRAAGDTTWCLAARLLLAWVIFTPSAWIAVMVLDGGVGAVMVSLIAYLALLAIAFGARFASGRWRRIQLLGDPQLA